MVQVQCFVSNSRSFGSCTPAAESFGGQASVNFVGAFGATAVSRGAEIVPAQEIIESRSERRRVRMRCS
jgi:hypothetical protein